MPNAWKAGWLLVEASRSSESLLEELEADGAEQRARPQRPGRGAGLGEQPEEREEEQRVGGQAEHHGERLQQPRELRCRGRASRGRRSEKPRTKPGDRDARQQHDADDDQRDAGRAACR